MTLKFPSVKLLSLLLCASGGLIFAWKSWERPSTATDEVRAQQPRSPRSQHIEEAHKWRDLLDESLPRDVRLNLANEIDADLPSQDIDFLFIALKHNPPGEEEKWWVILNEIMERMRISGAGSERYSDVLIELVKDKNRPPVARDYAIQHLMQWITPAGGDLFPGERDPLKKELALAVVVDAICDPSSAHTSIPGTGLMAIVDASPRLNRQVANRSWNTLRPFLTVLISGDEKGDRTSRIAAVQAVAIRKERSYLPVIRSMAASETIDASVRLSAIASLGLYGDPADRVILSTLSKSGGKFQYAAAAALQKFP